jgi:hypothetical protein
MADLYVQARILYHLYTLERLSTLQLELQAKHFTYVSHDELEKGLDPLIGKGYVVLTQPQDQQPRFDSFPQQQRQLKLSDRGKERTESLFTNFVEYIRQNHPHMSHQINIFDSSKSNPSELVRKVYHHIQDETELEEAFKTYLDCIRSI